MIKAYVMYTLKHFKAAQIYSFTIKQLVIWLITLIADTVLAVHIAFTSDNAVFNLFTLISIVQWCVTLYVVFVQYIILNPKKLLKKYLDSQPSPSVFEFGNDTIKITHSSKDSKGTNEHSYDSIELAYKRNDFYVLQIKQVGRIAFTESEITEGTSEELNCLLSDKLGDKLNTGK